MGTLDTDEGSFKSIFFALIIAALAIAVFAIPLPSASEAPQERIIPRIIEVARAEPLPIEKYSATIRATITGYNTVPEQTDETPCISASGDNICGRDDVVACPREYPLGTKAEIDGEVYTCLDRTAEKYDGRWDISCDKDKVCPGIVFGKNKEVKIIK